MIKKRFSKSLVLQLMTTRMVALITKHNFDLNNGTAQLGATTPREEALIERAIAYGRMIELQTTINQVENNQL